MSDSVRQLLEKVKNGDISVDEATLKLKEAPFEDIGYAKIDRHRELRQGVAEVIYGAGKTTQQITGIVEAMVSYGQNPIIITRLDAEKALPLAEKFNMQYFSDARFGIIGELPKPNGIGKIVVAAAGTSDIPVAQEAALTAEALGNEVTRLYDVGVSGLHRLLSHLDEIMTAGVVIAVAGMEGALASVLGGLVDCPVIAVPTSIGYGAAFGGLAALLAMLNSCASGVSVVNIDNGFGAGFLASKINHLGAKI